MDKIEDGEQYEMDNELRWLFVNYFKNKNNYTLLFFMLYIILTNSFINFFLDYTY